MRPGILAIITQGGTSGRSSDHAPQGSPKRFISARNERTSTDSLASIVGTSTMPARHADDLQDEITLEVFGRP
ncbi:hypothetical protein ACWFNS_03760 [Oerskovia enterophila]